MALLMLILLHPIMRRNFFDYEELVYERDENCINIQLHILYPRNCRSALTVEFPRPEEDFIKPKPPEPLIPVKEAAVPRRDVILNATQFLKIFKKF